MIHFAPGEVAHYYATRIPKLKQTRAARWRGPCPVHNGKNDNLSVDPKNRPVALLVGLRRRGRGHHRFRVRANGAGFLDAVRTVEAIVGRQLLDRPASQADVRRAAEAAVRERRWFATAA